MANLIDLALTTAISPAATSQSIMLPAQPRNITAQFHLAYGSGGATVDVWLQTSLDNGENWSDIANFHGTITTLRQGINLTTETPVTTQIALTDGAMAANTAQDGLLGAMFRCKYASTGTYVGTTLAVDLQADQMAAYP